MIGRTMVLETGTTRCTIQPMHAFTRRAVIQGMPEDFRLTAFAF